MEVAVSSLVDISEIAQFDIVEAFKFFPLR